MERLHRPVMLAEVIELMDIKHGGAYADMTFGEGGHSEAFLDLGAAQVVALDRDLAALERYREGGRFRGDPRLQLHHSRFSNVSQVLSGASFDAILVDLGVSTRQLLEAQRGFSFSSPGPLDMRMDVTSSRTLAQLLGSLSPDELAGALEKNTDMKKAKPIARRLLEAFRAGRLQTTADIASLMSGGGPRHPATVLFLALRMLVNEELREVKEGLPLLLNHLKPGGRLLVLTFHSTEDRAVKHLFQWLAGKCICEWPPCHCAPQNLVRWVTKKPLQPTREEMRNNPRSRSTKLRCVEKIIQST